MNLSAAGPLELSVVIPAFNEGEAIAPLLAELRACLAGRRWEVLVVNDGSTDDTAAVLDAQMAVLPELRMLTLSPRSGQSAALQAGFQHARGEIVISMDGDGQNDPADIPRLLAALEQHDAAFGVRAHRRDPWARTVAQRLANLVRNGLLHSHYRDVGCSLKAFRRPLVAGVQLVEGMHRFLPYVVQMQGARGVEVEVSHRPRVRGVTKYSAFGRGVPAFLDLLMVRRMLRRARPHTVTEMVR